MSSNANPAFLGTGWSFPPSFNLASGQVAMATGEVDIWQSLEIILATQPGERLMQPTFGCELSQFLFEELSQGILTRLQSVVSEALLEHEPRIKVNRLEVTPSPTEPGLVLIAVEYTVRQTNSRSNLVYPFYLTEATAVEGP
jgi:hypothetical protein